MQTLAPTWTLANTATSKWYVRVFPSLKDLAFLLPIVCLFVRFSGTQLLFADGDTGWHIRTGEWILVHRAVPTVDLFSFTKNNQAWFAWEWAWDVLFAIIHRVAGLAGVGFCTTLLIATISLLVYRLALRFSQNSLMSIAVTALTVGVSSIHWLARPHLFTWLFTIAFLNVIASAQSGQRRSLYLLPALMLLWVNFHGGFIAGLLITGCYALGEFLTTLAEGGEHFLTAWRNSAPYWYSFGLCTCATLVNPYGWRLHQHVFSYLTDGELLDQIQEFQSISFHTGPALLFEVMLVLAAFVVFSQLQKGRFSPALLLCLWAHFALCSARHIPLFMIVAAPFVASLLADSLSRWRSTRPRDSIGRTLVGISRDLQAMESAPRIHLASAVGLVVTAALFGAGQDAFVPQFNAELFPIQAMSVIEKQVGKRIYTSDQWGDFLLYRMYPGQRVFFDGRSDFYGNEFIKINQHIALAEHDWKSLLHHYAIELVVVKPETPISAVLKLTSGSKVLFDDGKVIVFDIRRIYEPIPGQGEAASRASSVLPSSQPRLLRPLQLQHSSQPI